MSCRAGRRRDTLSNTLIQPHGGTLALLMAHEARAAELRAASRSFASLDLSPTQLCDLELLLNGAFSPLRGFMNQREYESVRADLRLAGGLLWPIPITLDAPESFADRLKPGDLVALRAPEGTMLGVLHVEDIWRPDREEEARLVYGTTDRAHPGVARLLDRTHPCCIGGNVEGLQLPAHFDYREARLTPSEVRAEFARLGWHHVVALHTRNPMHRAHQELTLRAAKELEANILIHPVVGLTKPGDLDHYTRVRCYKALLPYYPPHMVKVALLPLAMRMAGPREAIWHAIIRKNFGCSHFIVGRDHAGPGKDAGGRPFYGAYDAQELMARHEHELGIRMVAFRNMVYVEDRDAYMPEDEVPAGMRALEISGTELRRRLAEGQEIPHWFSFPEVIRALQDRHPPRHRQGFTIFFTGLSGSGKSTVANVLRIKFLEMGGRPVTLLDGDIVRRNLSSELGFSREDRDTNIRRIGYVASEITRNRGIAICAPIAPYARVRREIRSMIEPEGGFILVHLSTPIEVCERRDRKGLYAKARAGLVQGFTGVSDPYEEPTDAEVVIDTTDLLPNEAAQRVLLHLETIGYVGPAAASR
ncbi:MAG TPA: bifunctional sulfate adenylyltransferase/adenylylsulfate kinase [Candidatus Polarisedimenticolia bacterium]|nr:bifunctional sulfate adenylyltransferase/adenylylsulfate kinase [Candidatus Polarisedimenticolia bacterium]